MKSTTLFFVLFATIAAATITDVTEKTTYLSVPLVNPSLARGTSLESSSLVDVLRAPGDAKSNLTVINVATGEQKVIATGVFTVASVSSDGEVIVAAVPGALLTYFQSELVDKLPLSCVYNLCNVTNITVYHDPYGSVSIIAQSGSGMAYYHGSPSSVALVFKQPLKGVAVVNAKASMISIFNQTTHSIQFFDVNRDDRRLDQRLSFYDLFILNGDVGEDFSWVTSSDGLIVGTTDETNLHRFNLKTHKWEVCSVSSRSNVAAFSPDEKYIVFGNGFRMSRFLLSAGDCDHQEWVVTSNAYKPYTKLWVSDSTTTAITSGFRYRAFTVYNFTLGKGSVCARTSHCPKNMICNATSSQCQLPPPVPVLTPVTTLQKSQSVYIINSDKFLTTNGFAVKKPSEAYWAIEEQDGGVYSVSTVYNGRNNHLYTNPQDGGIRLSESDLDIWSTFSFQREPSGKWTINTAADDSLWRNRAGVLSSDGEEGKADTLFELAVEQ